MLGAALGAALAACAKVGPPPGGPEDKTAPAIVLEAVHPSPGAAGVRADSTVTIVFTEVPDRRSVMRALAVFPAVDFRNTSWRGDTLSLVPDPGWAADRNTVIRIGPSAHDARGNALAEPFVLRFTTKAAPDSGTIRGRAWAGRERTGGSHLLVFAAPADTAVAGSAPAAVADAGTNGEYVLDGLDPSLAWRVSGLIDADGDARAGGRDEAVGSAAGVVTFAPGEREAKAPDFLVGTLDSLGHIKGDVKADSGRTVLVVARDPATGEEHLSAPISGSGAYSLSLPTGPHYRVSAFVDLDGDGKHGESEPIVEFAEDVRLDLASERDGVTLDLRGGGEGRKP
ncbi:MAG: Ig-like domain-containing protein [bacterium]